MFEAFVYLEEDCSTSRHHYNKSFVLSNLFAAWENLISSQNLLNCTLCHELNILKNHRNILKNKTIAIF